MVLGRVRKEWKAEYFQKVERILTSYDKVLICDADNVTSKQFQQIRVGKSREFWNFEKFEPILRIFLGN